MCPSNAIFPGVTGQRLLVLQFRKNGTYLAPIPTCVVQIRVGNCAEEELEEGPGRRILENEKNKTRESGNFYLVFVCVFLE